MFPPTKVIRWACADCAAKGNEYDKTIHGKYAVRKGAARHVERYPEHRTRVIERVEKQES